MTRWNLSEKTTALLPDLMKAAGITGVIVGIDEDDNEIRFHLLANPEPVIIKKLSAKPKPAPRKRKPAPKRATASAQTRGKKKA